MEAIGTVGATLVALFWPTIQSKLFGPKLELLFDSTNPSDRTREGILEDYFSEGEVPDFIQDVSAKERLFIGIRNSGKSMAKNVTICISNIQFFSPGPTVKWNPFVETEGSYYPKCVDILNKTTIDISPGEQRRVLIAYVKRGEGQ
jgi:hypothetical protein